MAIILNNGVNLPDIPEGVLDERPYAVVCQSIADPTTYTLMVSSWEVFCVPASITGYTCIAPWADQMNYWYHQGTDSDWNSPTYTKPLAAAEYTIVWANHDVYNATALESNTLIPGDIYFSKSESPKSGIVIDGITLPEFPADMLAKYPHVLIAMYDVGIYEAVLSKTPVYAVFSDSEHMGYAATENGHATFGIKVPEDSNWTCYSTNDSEMFFTNSVFPLSWTNYDVLVADYTTGEPTSEIFFRNCEAPKSGIVIDGIELPPFPTDIDYKYKAIIRMDYNLGSGDNTVFEFLQASAELCVLGREVLPEDISLPQGVSMMTSAVLAGIVYRWGVTDGVDYWSGPTSGIEAYIGEVNIGDGQYYRYSLVWSNHNIKNATAINPDTQEITVGNEIYWYAGYASDQPAKPSLPPYLCESSDWYKAVANEIRRIIGNFTSFEFSKDSIETALYGTPITVKSIIEGTYTKIIVPETVNVNNPDIFYGNQKLKYVDLGNANQIHVLTLQGKGNQGKLDTLIMRSETVVTVNGISGTSYDMYPLYGTNIDGENDTGCIYVPSALVDAYKNDSVNHWSEYADHFRAIEDYPDICGTS